MGIEDARHEEVEKRPEFANVVLQRRSRKEEAMLGMEAEENLPTLGLEVLNILCFVENHKVPFLALENLLILKRDFVRSDANLEVIHLAPSCSLLLSLFRWSVVRHDLKCWAPLLEFDLPVDQDTRRHDDQVRTPDALENNQHHFKIHNIKSQMG